MERPALPRRQPSIAAIAILILLVALHCVPLPQALAEEARKYVFMDEPLPPYTYGRVGEISYRGLTKDIFDELFGRLGMCYEIRLVPWARALDNARHGSCDGVPLLIRTEERERFLAYSDPVVENRELLYFLPARMGDFQWNELDDLKGLRIGLVRGYTYAEGLMEAIDKGTVQVTYSKDSTLNFTMLRAERVDIIVEDESVAGPLLAAHPEWSGSIAAAPRELSHYNWHIGLSRLSPVAKHVDAINRVLDEMHRDGTLARILGKR